MACFEDLVDRVDAKPPSEEGDEADNGDMASMEALMKLMDGAGGDDGEDVVKGIAALLNKEQKNGTDRGDAKSQDSLTATMPSWFQRGYATAHV